MYCKIKSAAITGISAMIIDVETDVGRGIPGFDMGGYLSSEVKEARERVRVAIKNSGILLPPQRVTVNLSPADIRKEGTGFDLPIAVGLLCANGYVDAGLLENIIFVGELSLDGTVNSVRGVLPIVCEMRDKGYKVCVIPKADVSEAGLVTGIDVIGIESLGRLIEIFKECRSSEDRKITDFKWNNLTGALPDAQKYYENDIDFGDIHGQEPAKRASLVAVAGMHNIMYIGAPGCGKTMIAKRLPTIMPAMTMKESLELTKIYSIAGMIQKDNPLMVLRPFRNPHHDITQTALIGGGRIPVPGEITLASKGVLFLDELTEFKSSVLENLRQPLEDKKVQISRVKCTCTYPADFMLVAAMNPCKCGYYPDKSRCSCHEYDIKRYFGKISKPFWDRFDICIQLAHIPLGDLKKNSLDEKYNSKRCRELVEMVRKRQLERFSSESIMYNSQMSPRLIKKYCRLTEEANATMDKAYERLALTMRGYHKVLKTALTIADLEESDVITQSHLCEALSYRSCEGGK